jgi:hypothetical protein
MLLLGPIKINSNIEDVLMELEAMDRATETALAAATKEVATQIGLATTQAMERLIYDQPLPASMVKRGIDRTGALLAGEVVVEEDPLTYKITTEDRGVMNARGREVFPTRYAEHRHELTSYPAPWREVGLEDIEAELDDIAERAFREAMPELLLKQ